MAKNTKVLTVLSTAAVTGLITAALGSTAFAKTSAILVQNGSNDYKYDYSSLASAFEDYSANPSNGALYQDYLKQLGGKSPVALYDDVQKTYIDYTKVASAFEDAQATTKPFDLNAFTESSKDVYTPAAPISDVTVGSDGKIVVTPDPGQVTKLAVNSVSAINLKQVVVTFNEAVDQTTAETTGNYVITSNPTSATAVTKAQLNDDKKSVTLTLDTKIPNQTGKVTVKVSKEIKDTNGNKLGTDYTATDLTYTDLTLPTIDSVTAVGNTQVVVKFSEPVVASEAQSILNYRLDGSLFTASNATLDSATQRVLTITFPSALTAGNHSLELVGQVVDDLNGLKNADVTKQFTIDNVADAPVATIVSATQQKVTFKFNRAVTTAPSVVYNGTTYSTTNPSGDNTTFVFSTGSTLPPAGGQITISKGIQDFYGNKTAADQVLTFAPVVDTVKPTVTGVTSSAEGEIDVQFSEALDATVLPASSNFTVKDAAGNTITVNPSFVVNNGVTDYTRIKLQPSVGTKFDVSANPYKVSISGFKDPSANIMDAVTGVVVNVPDTTAPTVGASAYVNGNEISVSFNEKVNATTVANLANYKYQVSGGNPTLYALPDGSKVDLAGDGKGAIITLPANWTLPNGTAVTAANIADVYVSGISDLVGNTMTDASIATITSETTNLATVDKVEAVDPKTVNITLNASGAIPTTLYGGDFKVTLVDGTTQLQVQSATISGRVITLKLMNALASDTNGATVAMVATPQGTATSLGTKFALTATPSTGTLAIADKIAPTISSAKIALGAGAPIDVNMSSDGLTGTADLTSLGTNTVTDLDVAASESGRLTITSPFDSRTVGQSAKVSTTLAGINTGILHDATLSQLQDLATKDGDSDDSTLTITGVVEDGTWSGASFTSKANHNTVTLKLKVK